MTAFEPLWSESGPLFVIPLTAMLLNVVVLLALCRMRLAIGHVRMQFISFALGLAVTALSSVLVLARSGTIADFAGHLAMNLLIYSFFGFCLFNVVNANVGALRVRILKEFLGQDPTPLSDAALCSRYPVGDMLDVRLARLLAGGQIVLSDGRYRARPRGVAAIGRIFQCLQRILLRR